MNELDLTGFQRLYNFYLLFQDGGSGIWTKDLRKAMGRLSLDPKSGSPDA